MRNNEAVSYESAFVYHTQGSAASVAMPVRQPARPRRPEPVRQPQPARRPQARPLPQAEPSRASRFWLLYAGLLILAAFLLGQVVSAYSELTVLAVENSAMKSDIKALQKEQSTLGLAQNERISLAEIEAIAKNDLGMVKLSDQSVFLLQSQNDEHFLVLSAAGQTESIGTLVWEKIKDGALLVWRFIN